MRDPYLYEGTRVLKNKLGITSQEELDRAAADYVSWRLKQLAMNPLPGAYTTQQFLDMHKFIFQDLYSRLGLYRRCGMHVVNYLLSQKVFSLPNKKENRPGLVDPLAYYL